MWRSDCVSVPIQRSVCVCLNECVCLHASLFITCEGLSAWVFRSNGLSVFVSVCVFVSMCVCVLHVKVCVRGSSDATVCLCFSQCVSVYSMWSSVCMSLLIQQSVCVSLNVSLCIQRESLSTWVFLYNGLSVVVAMCVCVLNVKFCLRECSDVWGGYS